MKKSNIWIFALIAIALVAILAPSLRDFFKDQVDMKATVDRVEDSTNFSDQEYNVELRGMNVPDANLKDFRDKTLFLNFWGTWCPPCREEWPTIQKLYDQKKGNMNFVLIAMQDKEDAVKKFLEENHYNVPVYIASSPLPDRFLVTIFPTTFVVDPSGKILKKEEGTLDWSSPEVLKFLEGHLK
ncbi:TlpA disulfide reductase family protein [Elizabethkingia sp. JS20170427COW]|uniref:TlpA family protein disulfide reductase n=1 Tax=Elizabethkingia sp. JS20170427COW TaxID=2583851 RepID=UPI001110C27D|nr:TlpA disulfide reductase family protein [Elizabethkingia sp. JS20170427COW]QCX53459.1 TlpA family protein disulfide reductase [Elizabethkingia sp. JS20170427COW]